jgi:hypothetical protein
VAELPETANAAIYALDDTVVATAGDPASSADLAFLEAISFDDEIIGYARVTLDASFNETHFGVSALLVALAAIALLSGAAALVGLERPRPRHPQPHHEPAPTMEAAAPLYFLAVNLYNQISMTRQQRAPLLASAYARSDDVCRLYGGSAAHLSGTGLLITFGGGYEEDRGFKAVCAALLLAEVLSALSLSDDAGTPAPQPVFRFGMHRFAPALGEQAEHGDAVNDAVLLSAVAGDGCLAISQDVFASLERPERLDWTPCRNALLQQLATTGPEAALVFEVQAAYQTLLAQQAELLNAQPVSTSSESTF